MSSTGKFARFREWDKELAWLLFVVMACLAILFLAFVAQSGWLMGLISFVTFVVVGFTGIFLLSWLFHWLDKRFYG